MSRSLKKPPYVDENLKEKIEKLRSRIAELEKQGGKEEEIAKIYFTPIRVWCRSSTIFPEMIGFTVMIYNGQKFIKHLIAKEMVNKKLGEFSFTRQTGQHGKAGTS